MLNNYECARNYNNENFSVLVKTENSFQLHVLEALFWIHTILRSSLSKQKSLYIRLN